jgi:hypothetical protein
MSDVQQAPDWWLASDGKSIGLWLTLAGGLAALVGSILVLTKTPKATT